MKLNNKSTKGLLSQVRTNLWILDKNLPDNNISEKKRLVICNYITLVLSSHQLPYVYILDYLFDSRYI